MLHADKFKVPGEHSFYFQGGAGALEAVLTVPEEVDGHYIALLGHPHSLQGGTMNNKVVTTMVRVFKALGIPCIRFNFRGVGLSEGVYDKGIGESDDMLLLARQCRQQLPGVQCLFAGFSFGSYVAYRTAALSEHALLITIAPSVLHFDYTEFAPAPDPWLIVQGDEDEIVPSSSVLEFAAQASPAIPVLQFAETGHFFHGKLVALKERLIEAVRAQVSA